MVIGIEYVFILDHTLLTLTDTCQQYMLKVSNVHKLDALVLKIIS